MRNVVSSPFAWSGAIVAEIVLPWNVMSTNVAVFGTKPQIIACFGEAASIEFDPEATAKRKDGGGSVAAAIEAIASKQRIDNIFDDCSYLLLTALSSALLL